MYKPVICTTEQLHVSNVSASSCYISMALPPGKSLEGQVLNCQRPFAFCNMRWAQCLAVTPIILPLGAPLHSSAPLPQVHAHIPSQTPQVVSGAVREHNTTHNTTQQRRSAHNGGGCSLYTVRSQADQAFIQPCPFSPSPPSEPLLLLVEGGTDLWEACPIDPCLFRRLPSLFPQVHSPIPSLPSPTPQVLSGAFVSSNRDAALSRMVDAASARYTPEADQAFLQAEAAQQALARGQAQAAGGGGGGGSGLARLSASMLRKISLTSVSYNLFSKVALNNTVPSVHDYSPTAGALASLRPWPRSELINPPA